MRSEARSPSSPEQPEKTYRDPGARQAPDGRGLNAAQGRRQLDVVSSRGTRDQQGSRSPTTPTCTRSSARTTRAPSRSSRTTCRWRPRSAARTSTSSATTSCTRSTSTTTATAIADITYQFTFETRVGNPEHVPLQHGPDHLDRQLELEPHASSTRSRVDRARSRPAAVEAERQVLGSGLACPPCNIGPLLDPELRRARRRRRSHSLRGGRTVFAGQRLEGFYVDLGAIFDLGDLRPFEKLHIWSPTAGSAGRQRDRTTSASTRSRCRCRSAT